MCGALLFVVVECLLFVGCWLFVGCGLLVVVCSLALALVIVGYCKWLFVGWCLLLLFVGGCLLVVVCVSLLVVVVRR